MHSVNKRELLQLNQHFSDIEFMEEASHRVTPNKTTKSNPHIFPLYGSGQSTNIANTDYTISTTAILNFIVALSGRYDRFVAFLKTFEEEVLLRDGYSNLAVMLYEDKLNSSSKIIAHFNKLKARYRKNILILKKLSGSFSRGVALEKGTNIFHNNALVIFIDVDIHIHHSCLYRIRKNTILGIQVYFPVFFTQFKPDISCRYSHCDEKDVFKFDQLSGYWRLSSFGAVAVYKQDFKAIGGFDKSIQGWGKEDLELMNSFVRKEYRIFRSAEPGMVHIFHDITCDPKLVAEQYKMCMDVKYNTYVSSRISMQMSLEQHIEL